MLFETFARVVPEEPNNRNLSMIRILFNLKRKFVILIGHPQYYPRFGFVPASRHGIACQWDGIPDEAFMVMILDEKAMAGISGTVKYKPEFDQAT